MTILEGGTPVRVARILCNYYKKFWLYSPSPPPPTSTFSSKTERYILFAYAYEIPYKMSIRRRYKRWYVDFVFFNGYRVFATYGSITAMITFSEWRQMKTLLYTIENNEPKRFVKFLRRFQMPSMGQFYNRNFVYRTCTKRVIRKREHLSTVSRKRKTPVVYRRQLRRPISVSNRSHTAKQLVRARAFVCLVILRVHICWFGAKIRKSCSPVRIKSKF